MATSKPQNLKVYPSSPPTPHLLTRANTDFYSAPVFDESRRKPNGLLPSPTTLEFKRLPLVEESSHGSTSNARRIMSNPTSPILANSRKPIVALTMASPVQPRASRQSLNLIRSEEEDMEETVEAFDIGQHPFMVNVADIAARPSSRNTNLTENEQRGMAILKQRLSTDGFPTASREGSPIPSSAPSASEECTRAFINQIDELNTLTNSLKVNLNDSLEEQYNLRVGHDQLLKTCDELTQENQELKTKMAKRERDYEVMSKNYLDHVRLIRATDDDHSTIIDRLTHLKAAIEHLIRKTQGSRSINLNRQAAIEHFRGSGLLAAFPVSENNLEPFHLNLYMESVAMSTLVRHFFDKPLCSVFDYNEGFQDIYDWMYKRNNKLAVRWRQQLCVMLTQDPETKVRQEAVVNAAASELTEVIAKIYTNANEGPKIRELCCKAFDLSVAMTALESVISPTTIPLKTPFDEETMATSLKSNPEGAVALVIFPAFKDTVDAFSMRAKVWCH